MEAILDQHDSRITKMEQTVEELNEKIHDLDTKVSNLELSLKEMKNDIEKSNQRSMWLIGTMVTVVSVVANVLVAIILHH